MKNMQQIDHTVIYYQQILILSTYNGQDGPAATGNIKGDRTGPSKRKVYFHKCCHIEGKINANIIRYEFQH